MTEALITDLGKIGALRVIARWSAMRYKGRNKPLAEIARELNVDAVVEGTVLRVGQRVRITARLIDPASNAPLWHDSYDRDVRDVLALHSEVARAIAREINIVVTPEEESRLARARPVDPEAHNAYLQGRYAWNQRTEEQLHQAIRYFNQAIEKDPDYALAHVGLAETLVLFEWFEVLPPTEAIPRAKTAAGRALELDDTLGEAYITLAFAHALYDWDWAGSERSFERALELNPNYASGRHWYAVTLAARGKLDEALAEEMRARTIDPHWPIIATNVALMHYLRREYDRSVEECRSVLSLHPNFALAHWYLGLTYLATSMFSDALAHHREAVTHSGSAPMYLSALGYACAYTGKQAEAREILRESKLLSERRYVAASFIAMVHVGLNEIDEAFAWLQKAVEQHDPWVTLIAPFPIWDPIREDPRYTDLLRRMNLEP